MLTILKKPFFIIMIVGFFLYLPTLFGSFVWDDEDFVFANRYVKNFEISSLFTQSITSGRNKGSNYFRPVQGTLYSVTFQAVGPNSFWFHLLNVTVHVGASCAVFIFLKKIAFEKTPILALIVSLSFLVHPVQTEAVSYISGLSDPLYVLFGFLSLVFFVSRHERKNMVPLSLGFFILSLLSKETGLVFLPILGLLVFLKESKGGLVNRVFLTVRETVPFLITVFIYLAYHATFINTFDIKDAWGNSLYANSVAIRLLTFVQNLFTYVGLLIFPKDLFMERDYWVQIQTNVINPYLILFIAINLPIIGGFFLFKKKSNLSNTRLETLIFCYLAFFASFIPYTGLVLINGIFYEHFLYLPLVFFFLFLVVLFEPLIRKGGKVAYFLIFLFLLALSIRNLSRQQDWVDPVRFYSQTLSHAPQSVRVTNGLGIAYSDKGDFKRAIETFEKGIAMSPKTPNFYHNIANNYQIMKNYSEAEKYYLKAIEVDPNFIFSWQSLAGLYQQTKQEEKLTPLEGKWKNRLNKPPTN